MTPTPKLSKPSGKPKHTSTVTVRFFVEYCREECTLKFNVDADSYCEALGEATKLFPLIMNEQPDSPAIEVTSFTVGLA